MVENRVRIGNQTAPRATRITEPFEYAVENGFDAFEWFLDARRSGEDWEETDLDPRERYEIGRRAAEKDVMLSVHAPWWLDLFDPGGYGHLLRAVQFATDLGAATMNLHVASERGGKALVEVLTPLLDRLADLRLRLSVENVPGSTPEQFNDLFARLADKGYEHGALVGMCLDLGHANLCSETRNDYLGFVDRLAPHVPIIHLHLHENYGDDDSHIPLFAGMSAQDASGVEGFVRRMKERGFSGCGILEVWPDPPSLLNAARDRLLRMFNSSEEGAGGPS